MNQRRIYDHDILTSIATLSFREAREHATALFDTVLEASGSGPNAQMAHHLSLGALHAKDNPELERRARAMVAQSNPAEEVPWKQQIARSGQFLLGQNQKQASGGRRLERMVRPEIPLVRTSAYAQRPDLFRLHRNSSLMICPDECNQSNGAC